MRYWMYMLIAFILAQTDHFICQNLQDSTVDEPSTDQATSVTSLHTEETVPTPTEQTVTNEILEQSTTITPSSVDTVVSSTIDTSHDIDLVLTTQSEIKSDEIEPSQSVIYLAAESVIDQSETVTQPTPIDQLENPLPTDDDKSFVVEEKSPEELSTDGISGEDILKVIKSLPEQPNGLHGTDQFVQQVSEGLPGVTDKPAETDTDTDRETDGKKDTEEEDGLTFNEWKQKELAKGEKDKQEFEKEEIPVKPKVSPSKQRKKKNYAGADCGAKVLASNPESTNAKGILNSNKDDYMINPCKVKRWVIIELCEPIQAYSVNIASLELFSSQPKKFRIYLSDRYPTKDWRLAGEKHLKDERVIQSFDISESHDYFAKFVKVELVDHYGDEHFCPLTILKVFGVAVTDYDDTHEETEVEEIVDDEENVIGGETEEEDTKNLFDSARDTVMTLVKKVLNVDPKNEADNNTLTNADNTGVDGTNNGSLSVDLNETKPALPNASIPFKTDETGDEIKPQEPGEMHPKPPEPGKTDSVSIVTKLEDDEQVETGSTSIDSDQTFNKNRTIINNYIQCNRAKLLQQKGKYRCKKLTTFCEFICLVFKIAAKISFLNDNKVVSKKDKPVTGDPVDEMKQSFSSKSEKTQQSDSSSEVSTDAKTTKQSDDISEIGEGESVKTNSATVTEDLSRKVSLTLKDIDVSTKSEKMDDTLTNTIKPSATLEPITQTETTAKSSMTMQVPTEPTNTEQIESTHNTDESKSSKVEQIDPSQTSVSVDLHMSTSLEREPTPSLPEDWKPDTKDLLETTSQSISESAIETSDASAKASASTKDNLDITATSDKVEVPVESTQTSPEASTEASPSSVSSSVLTPESSSASASSSEPTSVSASQAAIEPSKPNIDTPASDKPTVGVPEAIAVPTQAGVDVVMEKQGQGSEVKLNTADEKDEVKEVKVTNETGPSATDEKSEVPKVKTDRSLDIKVPPMSGTSRESAIMRLSNRIKVLEQNVSLSSRFLEELSKRYKKQSEDMMKLLNKTLAKLSNMTVENEVKNKIHDDEMYAMERRLENLTERVSKLTHSLQTINQQVTDRQMIATTVEILIIFVMFLILGRRSTKTEPLSPEIQKLIESMPPKASLNLPQRRNSISGPATPSKKLSSDLEPGGLNKFPSETSLDLRIVEPAKSLFGTQKLSDGVKKKKKKKQKLPDARSSWTGFDTPHSSQPGQEEKSKNPVTSLNLQTDPHKKITARKKSENTENWSIGGGAIPKKSTASGGRKKDEDTRSVGSPNTGRRDKQFQKGHRRQKSLPKQHFSDEEFRASAFRGGQSGHTGQISDHCSPEVGGTYQPGGHSDRRHTHGPVHGNSFTKSSSRRYSDNTLTLSDSHDSGSGRGKKHLAHNGYSDSSLRETDTRPDMKNSKSANSMSSHRQTGYSFDNKEQEKSGNGIDNIGPSHTSVNYNDVESRNSVQQSNEYFNGFNDYGCDIDYVQNVDGPCYVLNGPSPHGPMNVGYCFDLAEGQIEGDLEFPRQNGSQDRSDDSNNSCLMEKKGYRKLWGLFR